MVTLLLVALTPVFHTSPTVSTTRLITTQATMSTFTVFDYATISTASVIFAPGSITTSTCTITTPF
jgi:hypothetical protein